MPTVLKLLEACRSPDYPAMPYNDFVEFTKASAFTKYVYDYLSDDEYLGLQGFLLQYPEAGQIVRGSIWRGLGR